MLIPFGQFAPDLQALGNPGGLVSLLNGLPTANGYRHFKSLSPFSAALPSRAYGAVAARDSASNVFVFAGTSTALYRLIDASWTNVSNGAYSVGAGDRWEFAQWGQNILATNGTNPIQYRPFATNNFADLPGSPPVAKHIAVVRDFVVLGNTANSAGEVVWSGFNDAEAWTPDATTQSDRQPLRGGAGWVQGVVGGEYGVVLCERGVYRMTYVGTPIVWQFDEVLPDIGTPSPGSISRKGDLIFFLGQDGFYSLVAGQQWKQIGANRVDRFFWDDIDRTQLELVRSAIDKANNFVFWFYPGQGATVPDRALVYDWVNDKWGYVQYVTEEILMAAAGGTTLDSLGYLGSVDLVDFSFDDRAFAGDQVSSFGGFDSLHRLGFFSGPPLSAIFETQEAEIFNNRRSFVHHVRPVIDKGSSTVSIGYRNDQEDNVVYTGAVSKNRNGVCPCRVDARYIRARVAVTGEFTNALGVDPVATQSGL